MDQSRILDLLRPFLADSGWSYVIAETQLRKISAYLDILLRWNARMNLTSVRDPEEIVVRHFGESLFAARHIFPDAPSENPYVIDIGSGAGFPGLPMKLWAKDIRLTLIESNHKKATFLREVIRTLEFDNAEVFAGRAETFQQKGDVVAMRAVERFEIALPVGLDLMKPDSRIYLLISTDQQATAQRIGFNLKWSKPIMVPQSRNRVILCGRN